MNSNISVIKAFQNQQSADGRSLTTDGVSLMSYGWWEMARWVDGELITRRGASYSATTAKHRRLLWGNLMVTSPTPTDKSSPYMEL